MSIKNINKEVKDYTRPEKLKIIKSFLKNDLGIVISFGWTNFSNQMVYDIENNILTKKDLKVLKIEPTNNSPIFDMTTSHPKYINQVLKYLMATHQQYYIFKEDFNNFVAKFTIEGVNKDEDTFGVSKGALELMRSGEVRARSKIINPKEV